MDGRATEQQVKGEREKEKMGWKLSGRQVEWSE